MCVRACVDTNVYECECAYARVCLRPQPTPPGELTHPVGVGCSPASHRRDRPAWPTQGCSSGRQTILRPGAVSRLALAKSLRRPPLLPFQTRWSNICFTHWSPKDGFFGRLSLQNHKFFFKKETYIRSGLERRARKGNVTWRGAVEDAGGEAVYLQSQPDDAGRVGQHAMQNIKQGTQ